MGERIIAKVKGEEKFIGMLEGGTLFIERHKSKHLYKKVNGYGMDKDTLLSLRDKCNYVSLTEKETNKTFTVELDVFIKKGLPYDYAGHGQQLVLPMRYWTENTTTDEWKGRMYNAKTIRQ